MEKFRALFPVVAILLSGLLFQDKHFDSQWPQNKQSNFATAEADSLYSVIMQNMAASEDSLSFRAAELYPATKKYLGPDFELTDVSGVTVQLSDYRGKVVILNIWATWCPPCREEIPSLIQLQKKFNSKGLQIIGVSVDEDNSEKVVADFIRNFGINYPVTIDDGTVQEEYGPLSVIPTTYILDRSGYIRYYAPGYLEYEQLEEAVTDLVDQ